jgi:NAD(P)-dependent dehydrogenase (short-subunit alcohol dehydrogenase family)
MATTALPVALVTGASSGLGAAIARGLSVAGYRVYGTSRRPLEDGSGVRMIVMDVDDEASVARGIAQVVGEAGRIAVVVNNAGAGIAGAIEDTTPAEAAAQLSTNFLGTHRVCRAVLPLMRAQRGGRIINVSSLAGLIPLPFQAFYSASKFAIEAYSEALRIEVRPFGIHVSMIEPGDYATGFTAHRRMTEANSPSSPYHARVSRAVAIMARDEQANRDLEPVVRTVLRALAARHPRLRYPTATVVQRVLVALKPFLPDVLVEKLLTATYEAG